MACLRISIVLAVLSSLSWGADVTVHIANTPRPISPHLWGVFFEDINYAADGGLYAELVQNRSFEYQATEQITWNSLTCWEKVTRGDGKGGLAIDAALPVHPNNPHYVVVHVDNAGEGVGLLNAGYDGIPVRAGAQYDVSLFARQLYMNQRWGGGEIDGKPMPLEVRLESKDGQVLGETSLNVVGREWKRLAGTITASRTDDAARLIVLALARGGIAIDEISLFPRDTFRGRANGLRADLAQAVADLRPRFIRFPGGCLVHGNGLGNAYRWKDTIGPIEQRKGQANLWGYHQSVGLGYFEYFQFCQDIGAQPLPVVPAGVSCQNSAHTAGVGQQCLPIEQMSDYIQDVLDLVEWANGRATSKWGSKRAAAGHPEPFGLKFIGVGNEEHITPAFKERFAMIYQALKEKHPEITVIGTVGPFHSGPDFEQGWKIADELKLPIVDEHYYVSPQWCWENLKRYDDYDRSKSAVYLGEYAAHERDRASTLRAALAEAAYMTGLEQNGDIVRFASYAPLLARRGHTQWRPDLIYFDNTTVSPTLSYDVQRLFSLNAGDECLPTTIRHGQESEAGDAAAKLAASCVRDSATGDVIVKIVSRDDAPVRARIELSALSATGRTAVCTVLAGEPSSENTFAQPPRVRPVEKSLNVVEPLDYEVPAHSLTVIRIK